VLRVLRVLRDFRAAANQSAGQGGQIPGPASLPDAYAVLGIDPGAAAPDIKRRYMRLSLLIHPDKCQHKEAHAAFQAVTIAAKTLQDGGLRLALDAEREDAELRRRAIEAVQQQERERQWRVARGEEPAGPAIVMPGSQAGSQRESWMTELPPELGSAFGSAMMQQ
ncbi:J domain-containing protein, partial [Haematococcus lacustris]